MVKGRAKRTKRKGKKRSGLQSGITYLKGGFPDKMRIKINYSDLARTVSTSAGTGYSYYRLAMTDPTDPDVTGTGSQPPLFDNMRAIYNRWRVNSVKIRALVENYENYPTYVTLVGLFDPTTNSPTSPANPSTYDLQALPSHQRSERLRLSTLQSGDNNQRSVTKTFYPARFVGDNYYTSVNYSGGASAPANLAVVDVILQTGGASALVPKIGVFLSFDVEYDITFFNISSIENAVYD